MNINTENLKSHPILVKFLSTEPGDKNFLKTAKKLKASYFLKVSKSSLKEEQEERLHPILIALILNKLKHLEFLLEQNQDYSELIAWLALKGELILLNRFLAYPSVAAQVGQQNNKALRIAAAAGYIEIVTDLLTFPEVQADVSGLELAFFHAAQNGHIEIAGLFCVFFKVYPEFFQKVARHALECEQQFTRPFIEDCLTELQNKKARWRERGPFNLTAKEAQLWYYIIEYFIFTKSPELDRNGEGLGLFEIPAIAKILSKKGNVLLELAISHKNSAAIHALRSIPQVASMAAMESEAQERSLKTRFSNLSYFVKLFGEKNQGTVIRRLNEEELDAFSTFKDFYRPRLVALGGTQRVLNIFKAQLRKLYNKNPAFIERRGSKVFLPLNRQSFELMMLRGAESKRALEAYHRHNVHSAYRFFLKPNAWLHKEAPYYYLNETEEKYTPFDLFQEDIALIYLSALDRKMIDRLIRKLAQLQRAHNRQNQRDILEGDSPSAASEMQAAFYQVVFYHLNPNQLITQEQLAAEVKAFVFHYYSALISAENMDYLSDEVKAVKENQEQASELLRSLNIPLKVQARFQSEMEEKYKEGLQTNPELRAIFNKEVISVFQLPAKGAHFIQFYDSLQLLFFNRAKIESLLSLQKNKLQTSALPQPLPLDRINLELDVKPVSLESKEPSLFSFADIDHFLSQEEKQNKLFQEGAAHTKPSQSALQSELEKEESINQVREDSEQGANDQSLSSQQGKMATSSSNKLNFLLKILTQPLTKKLGSLLLFGAGCSLLGLGGLGFLAFQAKLTITAVSLLGVGATLFFFSKNRVNVVPASLDLGPVVAAS